jgi:Tol biopolymer transport system component
MSSVRTAVALAATFVIVAPAAWHPPALGAPNHAAAAPAGRVAWVFYSAWDRTQKVYSSTPTGTHTRLLARNATSPAWAPNGRWLAFERGDMEIWRLRAKGRETRRVSPAGWLASGPTWSPSGRRLAYTRAWEDPEGRRSAVYVVRRDGTGTRKLHSGYGPTWSADGRIIAFSSHRGLAVIRPDGRHFRVIRKGVVPLQLQFAPVGRRLVFLTGLGRVWILNMRTDRLRRVPHDRFPAQPQSITWTPDGRRLAYLRNHYAVLGNGGHVLDSVELCTMRPDGSRRRKLATLPSVVMAWVGLSWAP